MPAPTAWNGRLTLGNTFAREEDTQAVQLTNGNVVVAWTDASDAEPDKR